MNKRGLSNIEFIMAFILFIGFVGASIYLFNPVKSTKLIESSLTYTFNEIVKNATTTLNSTSVDLTVTPDANVINILNAPNQNVRIEDYEGNLISSGKSSNNIYFAQDNIQTDEKFIIIYFNEEFGAGKLKTGDISGGIVASSLSNKLISEKRISELNKSYGENGGYAKLKKELNLPSGLDFSFKLKLSNITISAEKGVPINSQIFSKTEIREVLRTGGIREFGYLTVSVW